jgi:protein-tyrosine phosphatase
MLRWLRRERKEPREPDYGRVAPWLLVGPALDGEGYEHLAEKGVTHVLDLRSEASDDPALMEALRLAWRRVPIDDREAPTSAQLDEINAWLDTDPGAQPVVYVHCEGGLGRSPTIAMALLMRRGFTRAEAHRLVTGARSVAAPTSPQDSWLAEIEHEIRTHTAESVASERD